MDFIQPTTGRRKAPSLELKFHALYDYWAFVELIGFHGGASAFSNVHREFAEFLTRPQTTLDPEIFVEYCVRLGQMPRGYLKSTMIVALGMWRIYRNPCIRIGYASNIKDLSAQFIREMRQYFEDSWLQEFVWNARPHIAGRLIPELDRSNRRWTNQATDSTLENTERKVIWNNQQLQVLRPMVFKEPTVFSTSVETRLTGHHYDVLLCDDIVDWVNSATLTGIKKVQIWGDDLVNVVNKFLMQVSFPPIYPGALPFTELVGKETIYAGTRYDPADYYAYLYENKDVFGVDVFLRNIYVNGVDNSDGYNWPEVMNEKEEMKLRTRLKSSFYPQYLNMLVSEVEPTFDADNARYFGDMDVHVTNDQAFIEVTIDGHVHEVYAMLVVDPASSLKPGSCDTAVWSVGIDVDGNLYGFQLDSGKHKPSDTCKSLLAMKRKWNTPYITIETVGYQLALMHTVREYMEEQKERVIVREYLPKGDKEKRIEHWLSPHFESSTIFLHDSLKHHAVFQAAIKYFGTSVPIDTVDALAIGREVLRFRKRKKRTTPKDDYGRVVPFNKTRWNTRWGGVYK